MAELHARPAAEPDWLAGSHEGSPAYPHQPCAECATLVDPLRAERVGIFAERFRYFCTAACAEHFRARGGRPRPERRTPAPPAPTVPLAAPGLGAALELALSNEPFEPEPLTDAAAESAEVERASRSTLAPTVVEGSDLSHLLLGLSALGATLTLLLLLAGRDGAFQTARLLLCIIACAALCSQYLLRVRDTTEAVSVLALGGPVAATAVAALARFLGHAQMVEALTLAAIATLAQTVAFWVMGRARQKGQAERALLVERLNQGASRLIGDEIYVARAEDLRPGEEILLQASDTVPADATVVTGSALVRPWFGSKKQVECKKADTLVAGAKLLQGQLRAVVSWAGEDRAWLRLTTDVRRRADLHGLSARWGRALGLRGAPIAAALAALGAFAASSDLVLIGMAAVASFSAFSIVAASELPSLIVARSVFEGLRHGIVFRSAEALDLCGRVSSTAFCARGTLLLGEPEVANTEVFAQHPPEHVLSLVAGAMVGLNDPTAHAALRAARARGIRPNAVRMPTPVAGLGITAIASGGEQLAVGSRSLMLRERISVAFAESRIAELEALGRSVLLVAVDRHLIGAVGLQDGLRPGSRAAVQHLLDVGVEPILLSVDSRETCEALARTLDIDHVRPELLPTEAAEAIQRLADGGATLAVVGNSPTDDACLSAAHVAVALSSAGSSTQEWGVHLASDDVREAAYAIRLAHQCKNLARTSMITSYAPPAASVLAATLGLLPAPALPLIACAAALLSVLRFRSTG
jgi:Cu+-exporting ATPase